MEVRLLCLGEHICVLDFVLEIMNTNKHEMKSLSSSTALSATVATGCM